MIRYLPKLFFVMALFFAAFGAAAYFTVTFLVKNEKTLVVPDLRGREIVDVLTLLDNFGLNARVKAADYSDAISKNHVMDQDPRPGDIIKTGRDVRLIISKGPKLLSMPDLKGLNRQQALLILEKNGLAPGVIAETFHDVVHRNIIISQYPRAGQNIEQDFPVDLLTSRGTRPRAMMMPDLTGLFLDEAVVTAEHYRLVVEKINPVHAATRPVNLILDQEPPGGHHVLEETEVRFSVNRKATSDTEKSSLHAKKGPLFRYRVPPGYLKQHIRVELTAFGATWPLYDEIMTPGREIWVLPPSLSMAVIFLYKNNELIMSEIYD